MTQSLRLALGIVRALAAHGVRDFVYSPGSRSAPFAYALDACERHLDIRTWIVLDERDAAFFAGGLSRADELATPDFTPAAHEPRPVALIMTSGGAVAEMHAGIAEAHHSHLPLIVVSADRPFEMRSVGASQTTTQAGIFASHVSMTCDIPADTTADRALTARVGRLVAAARGWSATDRGPVHLNVALRDPLAPASAGDLEKILMNEGDPAVSATRFFLCEREPVPWRQVVDPNLRTVMIAGDGAHRDSAAWAERAGIPLLAEPTSGLTGSSAWIPHQQSILSDSDVLSQIEQVIVTGRPTLSRPVSRLLARDDTRIVVVSEHTEWPDVAGRASSVVPSLCDVPLGEGGEWRDSLRERSGYADDALDPEQFSMLTVADLIWRDTGTDVLVLGASNTVRAFDLAIRTPAQASVVSNRGLAGIDGTIATAWGCSANGARVRAVMGDLTFFHDASALALRGGGALSIIVLDDQGGSIFASLEHGQAPQSMYERWFGCAQSVDIESLCRAYGWSYCAAVSLDDVAEALALPIDEPSVIHVKLTRDADGMRRILTPSRSQKTSR